MGNKIESFKRLLTKDSDQIAIEVVIKNLQHKEKFVTFCSSEAIELVKEKFNFIVKDVVEVTTLTNIREDFRKGVFIFKGYFDVPDEEKWLFENKNALESVQKGLEQAKNDEFVESKSIMRRKKSQKKDDK